MSTRDTQFKNFAMLLFNDTKDMFNNHYLHVDNCEYEKAEDTKNGIIAYLAQCAYDLVQHTIGYNLEYLHECGLSTPGSMGLSIQPSIPDMVTLPGMSA